jgi:hypothetical protein
MQNRSYNDRADLARRIRAAGVPISAGNDGLGMATSLNEGLLVYVDGGETETVAFDWCGGIGCIINVVITINVSRFAISAFGLELPWTDEVRWLENPRGKDARSSPYRFGRTLEFDWNRVLNHRADVQRIHSRGTSVVGCLLGTASASIPDDFRHGVLIPSFLDVFDQWGRCYRTPISLWSDRSGHFQPPRPKSKRKSLLDSPDSISELSVTASNVAKCSGPTRYRHGTR